MTLEATLLVVRKQKIVIDGREVEVDVFETEVVPGSGQEESAIDSLLREDEIEKEVREAVKQIDAVAAEYGQKEKDVWYYYRIGEILQFVDSKGFEKERPRIWHRIAADRRPLVFFGKEKVPKKIDRYPEYMYRLSKQDKEIVGKLNWSHWFEILQYPTVFDNREGLKQLISDCVTNNLSRDELRKMVLQLNSQLSGRREVDG